MARTFLHALFWDVFLALPGLRRLRRPATPRWQAIARRYRALAIQLGGFLIKLGQFLSVRVDLLPREITRELAGLQDEVPAGPFPAILQEIERELGRPAGEVFASLEEEAVGAASLAQVHRARLAGAEAGQPVVVKVLRPGIEVTVETDLAAVRLALRLLRISKKIRRRVDLERLADEIERTTRRELDLGTEGKNAERFAAQFAADRRIEVPAVFWQASTRRILTLGDVGYLKIGDRKALLAAGVDPKEVARTVVRVYLQQVFVHSFVHADPHPGNLFVHPLPKDEESDRSGTPFRIAFVDFGMVADIPEHLRTALREYAIGFGTRDAARMVRAYQAAGALLPGADLDRLVEAHEALFDRFWGVPIGDLRRVALSEAGYFFRAYRDLLQEVPFQLQVDLLFVARAMGMLSGLATQLDPQFDPWAETVPFAKRLAGEAAGLHGLGWWGEVWEQLRRLGRLPFQLEGFLGRALAGTLTFRSEELRRTDERLARIERLLQRGALVVLGAGFLVSGTLFELAGRAPAPWFFAAAGLCLLAALLRRA